MRGRVPRALSIRPADLPMLRQIAGSQVRPAFQVRRARILLAVASGEQIAAVADQNQCDPASVWRTCRRYEKQGLATVTNLTTLKANKVGTTHTTGMATGMA